MTDTAIHDLKPLANESTLLGKVSIFGVLHHVMLIEVELADGHLQTAVNDPHGRYQDLQRLADGGLLAPVRVPGFPGQYVVSVFPFIDN